MNRIETAQAKLEEIITSLKTLDTDFETLKELRDAADRQGTIIHGTGRLQDLIPTYLSELKSRDEYALEDFEDMPQGLDDDDPWWDSEEAMECRIQLEEALDGCDEVLFFDAHPGDGSDMGFWMAGADVEALQVLETQAGGCTSLEQATEALVDMVFQAHLRSEWYEIGKSPIVGELRLTLNTLPRTYVIGAVHADSLDLSYGYNEDGRFQSFPLNTDEAMAIAQFVQKVAPHYIEGLGHA